MWIFGRILRIPWLEKVTNPTVSTRIKKRKGYFVDLWKKKTTISGTHY